MCTFYFLNAIHESQRSQGWSEKERTVVCCIMLHVCFEAFRTWLPLIIIRGIWRWPRTQTSPSDWKECRASPPFNLCKCKMYFVKGTWDFTLLCIKRFEVFFLLKRSLWYQQLHIVSVLQIKQLGGKVLSCFWKGSTNEDHFGSVWQFILMNF